MALQIAGIVDTRYGVKGCDFLLPYGLASLKLVEHLARDALREYDEIRLPAFVSEDVLRKEERVVARLRNLREREAGEDLGELRQVLDDGDGGTAATTSGRDGIYRVRDGLLLRPKRGSLAALCSMLPLWIRSHADLPFRAFHAAPAFEVLRGRHVPLLQSAERTVVEAFVVEACVDNHAAVEAAVEAAQRILYRLGISFLATKRPDWSSRPGAWYTVAIDALVNGSAVQVFSSSSLDQVSEGPALSRPSCARSPGDTDESSSILDPQAYSREFGITFEGEDGDTQYPHVSSSSLDCSRLLGASVAVSLLLLAVVLASDLALLLAEQVVPGPILLPPAIAPIQVIVVPIFRGGGGGDEAVLAAALRVRDDLERSRGLRCRVDSRMGRRRPGQKFAEWELKGVPLRIEIGQREVAEGTVVVCRRAAGGRPERRTVPAAEAAEAAALDLEAVERDLSLASDARWSDLVRMLPGARLEAGGEVTFEGGAPDPGFVYELAFCGTERMAEALERATGLTFLGYSLKMYRGDRACALTGKPTKNRAFLATSIS